MSDFTRKSRPSGSGPVALIILDGFGLNKDTEGNAVALANTPTFDKLWATYPHTQLQASGEAVGLPEGQFGNSEVGHSNIGAGRVLYQDLTKINKAIREGDLFQNDVLKRAMNAASRNHKTLHLCGLVSDGGVHSHIDHLLALLRMAAGLNIPKVVVHAFLDGRDTSPKTGAGFVEQVEALMDDLGTGIIGSVIGRYYAMDRDKRWERVSKAYNLMVHGEGEAATDLVAAIRESYDKDVTDEFVLPIVHVDDKGDPVGKIEDGDSLIFFNFRPDRAIQLSQAFTNDDFAGFDRGTNPPHVHFVSMTKYSDSVGGEIAYPPDSPTNTYGEVVSNAGLRQLRIAETEKFPHVTFFFSGGREQEFPGEERILISSPKVATYDLQPEMSAYEVAENAAKRLRSGEIDTMILNFANPDMVGHTGVLEAAIKACEAVDTCLDTVLTALFEVGGVALVTADHGNADVMYVPETHEVCTTHTTNPVPLIITKEGLELRKDGVLADLAPTMLDLLGVKQPAEMTGKTLIV
ncbi:2,3-bisphosphoglycerate-independent phosphoglycerate mutase [Alicyclobacillus dauci]|uniref:2,3-bisphosphoglycerate-independent phosphoglycerate mutase n=1 Tax=Alicyclobacillus dauci TaxID=1475485 RepID=A0ABY6Z0X7_9BACL|nr:2,3-bisphosphoglycerate-independent phosphoglycerate mutase [Alicyclobacillus dauci]WAH36385.1 2,3-bisphosphoglycerate-independent phosphoglycerate mutase [Alicyclobacillus dauci]